MSPSLEEVETLAGFSGNAFLGYPRPMRIRWLGTYLRDHRGAIEATDEMLAKAAGEG
ncbi:MAG: hypothetical protein ACRYGP_29830 [Janthinobacterium lividum]